MEGKLGLRGTCTQDHRLVGGQPACGFMTPSVVLFTVPFQWHQLLASCYLGHLHWGAPHAQAFPVTSALATW